MKNIHCSYNELFEKAYNDNYTFLLKYLLILVRDFDSAEDLAHDIFLRIYKSKSPVITDERLRYYLKTAARNIAIDHFKRKERSELKNKMIISDIKDYDKDFYDSLENKIIEGEVVSTVHDVIENFNEKRKKIFISRIMENKTRKEVSEENELSPYKIKVIENEILQNLRKRLKQYLE